MIINVSDELVNLRDELIKRGYNVVSNENKIPCDAIICNLKNGGLMSLTMQNNVRSEGTLIIDAGSKNIEEIEYILNNRVYTSLL